jgi:hypothetical protein
VGLELSIDPPQPRPPRRRSSKRLHTLTAAASVAGHALVLLVLLTARGDAYRPPPPEPVPVELVQVWPPAPEAPTPPAPTPAPQPSPAPPAPAPPAPAKASAPKPTPAKLSPPRGHVSRASAAPAPEALIAGEEGEAEAAGPALSDAQIASAATVGSGGASRPCDMARRLQTALRRDSRIQAAVAEARAAGQARAIWVWNGDWIRSNGQDGNGLAAVREVIQWEVAFAPAACRAEPVRGLILISMNDRPGAPGLVVGSDRWLWSDLLGLRR